jgi:hypothetical protein
LAAADHTSQRARQGRGRRIRRRVGQECARRRGATGSLIPHACAIRPLVIAMIEAPFGAPAMAPAGARDRSAPRDATTCRGAVRVPSITRDTNREEPVAEAAGFLAKGRVHDVGAAARTDWTRRPNRGTREKTGSVRRSIEAVTEGLEGSAPGPHLIHRNAQRTRPPPARSSARPGRVRRPMAGRFTVCLPVTEGALGGIHN